MKAKRIILGGLILATITLSGCDMFLKENTQNAPAETTETPVAQETVQETPVPQPTEVPVTATPMPTSTPAPRLIGTKTSQSKFVFLTNSTNQALRQVFLKTTGTEDWGKNMIPNESTIKASETVQMFYEAAAAEGTTWDIKIVDKAGNAYAIYGLDLGDMENAVYKLQDGSPYISYLSLASKSEANAYNSEVLAQDYSSGLDNGSTSGDSQTNGLDSNDTTWDYQSETDGQNSGNNTGSMSSEDYLNADAPTDYDPSADYSMYEGNPNYGYYNDYGTWISYY